MVRLRPQNVIDEKKTENDCDHSPSMQQFPDLTHISILLHNCMNTKKTLGYIWTFFINNCICAYGKTHMLLHHRLEISQHSYDFICNVDFWSISQWDFLDIWEVFLYRLIHRQRILFVVYGSYYQKKMPFCFNCNLITQYGFVISSLYRKSYLKEENFQLPKRLGLEHSIIIFVLII